MTTHSEWLTIPEAARRLKVGRATLYRWVHEGRLAIHHFGKRTSRIASLDIDRMGVRQPGADAADEWTALSAPSFEADWDNEIDAVYDDWRSRYGVLQG